MKKFFYLALFMPVMFASCSQEDKAENTTDIPSVENVKFKVEALPKANVYGEQGTRVWSGTTLEWEFPGGLSMDVTDRIALAWHQGWSDTDLSHSGEYSGYPFTSEPSGNILTLICDQPSDGGADTGDYQPWRVFGTIKIGCYTAYYPWYANKNQTEAGAPVRFDLSEQSIKTNEYAAYMLNGGAVYTNDGLMGVATQEANADDTEMSIRLNPVSSLMHLVLSNCPEVTFTKIEINGVGTGFEYYPQEGKAFGFSTEDYTKQKTAAALVAEGFAQNYQQGTVTLTGEATPENGVLEVFAWYFPVVEASANGVSIILTDNAGATYTIENMPNMAEAHGGAHLTRFNSGVTIRRNLVADR